MGLSHKYNPDGSVAYHKAFLVVKGSHQVQGFDFDETFSPVVKKLTILIILALVAQYNWSLTQLDAKKCFSSWCSPENSINVSTY